MGATHNNTIGTMESCSEARQAKSNPNRSIPRKSDPNEMSFPRVFQGEKHPIHLELESCHNRSSTISSRAVVLIDMW